MESSFSDNLLLYLYMKNGPLNIYFTVIHRVYYKKKNIYRPYTVIFLQNLKYSIISNLHIVTMIIRLKQNLTYPNLT